MFVHSHLQPSGQVGAVIESAGALQRVNPAAVQSVLAKLGNLNAVATGSGYKSAPTVLVPGLDPKADFWAFSTTKEATGAGTAYDVINSAEPGVTTLIDAAALQKSLNGESIDIGFLMTKSQDIVKLYASPGAAYAVLKGGAGSEAGAAKKPEGIAMPIIGGLIVGAVATVVGGPVTGVAAGVGTAALLHYAA